MIEEPNKMEEKFFEVAISNGERSGYVYAPSSLDCPRDNTVIFVTPKYVNKCEKLFQVKDCLIFWPENCTVPDGINNIHFLIPCAKPRLEFAKFFNKNGLRNVTLERQGNMHLDRFNDKNITIMPNTYIGKDVFIGDNVYIGSGVRLVGKIRIGNNVIIRENSVLGADGLSFERDDDDTIVPIPQFGGVIVEDNVVIGANVVIARAVIDNTIIQRGCVIDNGCFISHNVVLGENVAMVGESIIFGSCHIGKNSFISGNTTIRQKIDIGEKAFVGMGSVVVKDIPPNNIVYGNPATAK